jgi:hypothetical protein
MTKLRKRLGHRFADQPALRAMILAAPPINELATVLRDDGDLVCRLAIACGELVHGFSSPVGSVERRSAHHRAWVSVRELDRSIGAARFHPRATAAMVAKAQRAIDRADVMITALPGVLAT